MYKNPLNNGDISDYNSLKKQRDYGSKVKKYQSIKLKTEPTELQKYYQYQTYQQPILDELNYVAERMRTEYIQKKTEDYNFIEGLKIKREGLMKETSKKEGEDIAREELFDKSSLIKNEDMTSAINTDIEMVYPIEQQTQIYMNDLFGDGEQIIELSKEEKASNKIKYAYKNKKARKEFINVGVEKRIEEIKALIKEDKNSTIASQAETEINIPKGTGGRPKGSKNTPKRTLNL
jgi:hypothetical protein